MALGKIIGKVLPKVVGESASVARKTIAKGVNSVVGEAASAARKAIAAARKAANPFDYGRKVFALPEGRVMTRSGREYTRIMGQNGERIYRAANGNEITFNGLLFERPGFRESAIFKTTPDGGSYSLKFSTMKARFDRGRQEITRFIREKIGGNTYTRSIEFNPQGRVAQTRLESYNAATGRLSGIETRYGCPSPSDFKNVYGWLNMRNVTVAKPHWTSLKDFA